jgi:hypothetical protein
MNAETFAEWMRRQGYKVFRTASSYWYTAGPCVLQAFPYHWTITPQENEIRNLMLSKGITALRYSTPVDLQIGKLSYHVILQKPYELDMLKSHARNGVKRGLEHFSIERISFRQLATEGWILQQDTLARQDRLKSMTRQEWECLCRSAEDLAGFETWAAISNGKLAGAVIICRIDDVFTVPFAMSHSRFLSEHVNNAIFYAVSKEMLNREGVNRIFYTVQSLDAPANVDEFKFRMGLTPIPVCQCVEFHPILKHLVTPGLHALTNKMCQRYPSNPLLAKTEGMLRFHLEGKRSIQEQTWAECLLKDKENLLQNLSHAHIH